MEQGRNRARSLVAATLFTFAGHNAFAATTYYVAMNGSDLNSGTSLSAPLRKIQAGVNKLKPGDRVYVMSGVYSNDPLRWKDGVVVVTNGGTPGNYIVIRAYPGQHPVISTTGNSDVWDAVQINASWVKFAGFEVVGNAQSVTLNQATTTFQSEEAAWAASVKAHESNPSVAIQYPGDALTNGNCVTINRATHVVVAQNLVHDCSASGIASQMSDYVEISANEVFNTSWWTAYDTSGINVHQSLNSDLTTGYHNFVVNNISHDNANTQPYYNPAVGGGVPTDGNGIIVDVNQSTSDGNPYLGRTLVMGNILYNNGGSGIHAFESAHVDMFNNTAYMNNQCPVSGSTCGDVNSGQIFAAQSSDVNIYNDVMISPAGKKTYSNWENTSVSEGHNLLWAAGGQITVGNGYVLSKSDIVADPLLNNAAGLGAAVTTPAQDIWDIANPRAAATLLVPLPQSPLVGAGTGVLSNGQTMGVTPEGMDGLLTSGIPIGAL